MTPEITIAAFQSASDAIGRYASHLKPKRSVEPDFIHICRAERLEHALWMCEQGARFAAAGELGKAFRWLGFVQGVLWADGVRSIDDMRADNAGRAVEPRR